MEIGEKYLNGNIDLGALGKVQIKVFKNEKKEKDNQPDFRIVVKDGDNLKSVGALWTTEKKEAKEGKKEETRKDEMLL